MDWRKKNGSENRTTKCLILVTVIIQLITSVFNLIDKLIEQGEGLKALHLNNTLYCTCCQDKSKGDGIMISIIVNIAVIITDIILIGLIVRRWNK